MRRIILALLICGLPLFGGTVYFNDFNSYVVGPELSVTPGTLAVMAPLSGCSSLIYCTPFLGVGITAAQPLANHTVTLTLTGLSAHTSATVSLALFILNSWDGDQTGFGPDYWRLAVSGGPTLLDTTFAIVGAWKQSYPANYPASPNYAARTGATENDTLGGWFYGDSVYLLSYTFPHTDSSLALTFRAWNLQGWSDEGWGIDNLRVDLIGVPPPPPPYVIPEPGSLILLGGGLAAIALMYRRRRSLTR